MFAAAPLLAQDAMKLTDAQRRMMSAMQKVGQIRAGEVDRALIGDWRSAREMFTSTGAKPGEWLMRIDAAGRVIGMFRGTDAFQLHAGVIRARDGAWRIDLPNVQSEIAAYEVKGNAVEVTATTAPAYRLERTGNANSESFAQIEALLRRPPGPDTASWTMRAAEWARYWQADARLVMVRMISLTDKALLSGNSHLEITFDSPKAARAIAISPGPLGGIVSAVIGASERARSLAQAGTIPLPIVDLTDVVKIARKAGNAGPFSSAQLTVRGASKDERRLIWWLQSKTNERKRDFCFDVASGRGRDCIALFGDPVADYEALAARAERARRALSASGGGGVPALSPYPDSVLSSTPSSEPDWNAIERRRSAESAAYWSSDPTAYGRVVTGTCSSDDRARYGC